MISLKLAGINSSWPQRPWAQDQAGIKDKWMKQIHLFSKGIFGYLVVLHSEQKKEQMFVWITKKVCVKSSQTWSWRVELEHLHLFLWSWRLFKSHPGSFSSWTSPWSKSSSSNSTLLPAFRWSGRLRTSSGMTAKILWASLLLLVFSTFHFYSCVALIPDCIKWIDTEATRARVER